LQNVPEALHLALADRYVIESELGEGGMANVYLAHDVKHNRKVALKVLRPELAAVIGGERFLQEIETTANLQHPHILSLHDSGEVDGTVYYVMPYIEGESLRDRLVREKQLPVADAVRLAGEVAGALDYAHRHGVIHRDIKPENILLHDGRATVADFGIALAASSAGGSRMTETGMSLGTPHYMSPEQAMGERELDARTDIYALGCVLYEMLTGEPPFNGPTAQAIVAKVMASEAEPVTTIRKTVPPEVADAVHAALQKLPADRFASAAEFASALSGQGQSPTRSHAALRAAPTSRVPVMGAMAVAIVATVAAVWGWSRPDSAAPVHRIDVRLDKSYLLRSADSPALSPDGSLLAYNDVEGNIVLLQRDRLLAEPVRDGANGWGPFFSPDNATVGFVTGFPGDLVLVPVAGGPSRTVVEDSAHGYGASWGDDGWIYYLGTTDGQVSLKRVRPEGGAAELIAAPRQEDDELAFHSPEMLPGGKSLLATLWRRRGEADIVVIDIASGVRTVLATGVRGLYARSGHLVVVRGDGVMEARAFDVSTMRSSGRPVEITKVAWVRAQGRPPIALSHEGTLLYMEYEWSSAVVRVTPDGRRTRVDAQWDGRFESIAVSPTGDRLLISAYRDGRSGIWVKALDTGPLTRLANEGTYAYRPTWSPDGRSAMFITDVEGRPQAYSTTADGTADPENLLSHVGGSVDEVFVSRDGQWTVFRAGSGGGRDLYAIRNEPDAEPIPLAVSEFEEYSPTLSPDGRWLAYGSDESGRSEVYVRPFPDAARGRWQVSRGGGTEPLWGPEGGTLFYRRGERGDLVRVQVAAGDAFRVTSEQVMFSTLEYQTDTRNRNWDISPDGESFYFILETPVGEARQVMVLNWFAELEQISGGE